MKRLKEFVPEKLRLFDVLWLGAPVAMWFAYQPLIRLGQDGTMNYELSVAILYVVAMALMSLPILWRRRAELARTKTVWVSVVPVALMILSLLWTMNLPRGVLTVGVTGILYIILLGAIAERAHLKQLVPKIIQIYLYSSLVMCVLAIVQFFAGLWLDAQMTLLCAGCVAEQFGFVRPNVFLIEPQFLGNVLLPAALLLIRRIVTGEGNWRNIAGLSVVVMMLVLTLSRGALLAFVVGVVILVVVQRREVRSWILTMGLCMVSLVGALGLQGLAAVLNPKVDETFVGAVTKSIHQLTMGIVDLRPKAPEVALSQVSKPTIESIAAEQPHFDGYVEESTSARTERTFFALQRWSANMHVPTLLFGTGIGSAGMAMHEMFPEEIGAREIVQNEYVEILLERGIVGLASFLAVLAGLCILTRRQKWLWAIIAAFMIQWLFFSGYPNALHVYLSLIVLALYVIGRRDQSTPAMQY